ncbi:DUF3073 domain-containing protein [Yimella sp. cx-573]|nr:DUF3073 domain-containing protein [Yimella sp. cx-573]
MGRGRAKAKQTKVARELKYFSPDTDLNALERELRASSTTRPAEHTAADASHGEDDDDDDYADWASHNR